MRSVLEILVILTLFLSIVQSEKKLIITKTEVEFNDTYIASNEVEIIKNGTAFNVFLNIKRNYPYDPFVIIAVAKRDAKTDKYTTMIKFDVDVCRLLGRKNPNDKLNLLQVWIETYWKQGNMPRECPVVEGNYFWKGVRIDRQVIPPFAPVGRYRTTIRTYFKEDRKQNIPHISVGEHTQLKSLVCHKRDHHYVRLMCDNFICRHIKRPKDNYAAPKHEQQLHQKQQEKHHQLATSSMILTLPARNQFRRTKKMVPLKMKQDSRKTKDEGEDGDVELQATIIVTNAAMRIRLMSDW
ncbi:unnamed protein product [Ceratitis capitata]|uniref:(Mediterranean fruit fly) hypothetical protein n=1 Tax=Ceratitis capitata TaxID=7213 RepID=A0A811V1F7_CERCA|nr:unnamed protein product [Ceratitis capitata]